VDILEHMRLKIKDFYSLLIIRNGFPVAEAARASTGSATSEADP
jgi:hypothetical protein